MSTSTQREDYIPSEEAIPSSLAPIAPKATDSDSRNMFNRNKLCAMASTGFLAVTLVALLLVNAALGGVSEQQSDVSPQLEQLLRDADSLFPGHGLADDIGEDVRSSKLVKRTPQRRQLSSPAAFARKSFSLAEIVDNAYRSESWNGTWVSDTEYAYRNRDGALALISVETKVSRVLVPGRVLNEPRVFKYWLSPDHQYLLMAIRPQKLFRHSFIAVYDVYNIRSGARTQLSPSEDALRALGPSPGGPDDFFGGGGDSSQGGPARGKRKQQQQQLPLLYATWSESGHALAYVFNNNIFYRATPESDDVVITKTGIPGTVFNGIADWVYEEEVLSDTRALWFSPDGNHLAWIEFNDTGVDVMPLEIYGQPGRLEFQYPIPTPLRYPKPGRTNPFVNVYVAPLTPLNSGRRGSGPRPILLQPPAYFGDKEKIIYAVTWANENEVSLTWENRHQNYTIVSVCDVSVASCGDSLVMTEPNGWMELEHPPVFTKDGRQFAMVLSADGYPQVNVVNRDTNQRVPITSGQMVVTNLYHWDETNHLIYFRATRAGAAGERHLYTVTDFESGRPGLVTCLSCDVVNSRGGQCGYNKFKFSTDQSYYTMSCLGPHVPQEYLYKTVPNSKVATLVTNSYLSNALALKNLPKISNLDVSIDGGRYVAKVRLYLPPDFDERKKYPLVINVYGAPNSQQVNDRFKLDWGTYLSTQEDVIYGIIDGRGSGYRGDDLLFEIYYKLGKPEVQDQLDVTSKLVSMYNFIDKDKVAIWGWSYGGFTTTSVLAHDDKNVFKCGIAVAPVTNWIYYDTIYTERYMGLPSPNDNLQGYQDSDLTNMAEKLRGKKLLMVHGTADDNVHYQQSMMLTRALEEADVLFQQLSYPDENHGIVGLRPHFYHSLTNFLLNDCFNRNQVV